MDQFFGRLLSCTRFSTNRVSKSFLPRRIGLGYASTHERLNRDVIRPCLKARRKTVHPEPASESEETGKSAFVKKARK